jgi:serine phosphatase RsbU (regulator of sigma subunit)
VRIVLRTALGEGLGPAAALERLNQAFLDTAYDRGVFATAAVVRIRGNRLTYASAGHPPPLVAGSGRARALRAGGPPAGVIPETGYPEGDDELEPGGSIAVYSDGLLGQGGRQALDRLAAILEREASAEPASIVDSMMSAVDDSNDDRTVIVARRA